ncbi:LysR family transcriptional regulator [Bradyrhizobium sp. 190]|uniref:LysR substrate-binding domain-containing protein n=1 Tax=Bradyrhizobium sp. 190 TaxID=2782658 RepID=UPI001FFB34D8|nr:LysR substrate-binding domain-containing protein [Bradyrhizobium sp. 190]MCK1513157.1 LysR family transcriptional regulator [Bradyrhizobium sp. 190]
MTSLRAFEATARHLSFTRAGEELGLSQTAVSHQIGKLESLLGARLFVRKNNQVQLSPVGRDYLSSIKPEIIEIANATTRIVERSNKKALSLVSLTGFCMRCLVPRLPRFLQQRPDILLSIETEVSFLRFRQIDYDLSIQYGNEGDWPGLITYPLCNNETFFPVCSPALVKKRSIRHAADLRHHCAIMTSSLVTQNDWRMWLDAAKVPELAFERQLTFGHLLPAVQAAVSGLGVTMARDVLVANDLAEGALIAPLRLKLTSGSCYRLVIKPERAENPQVRAFRDWILGEFVVADRSL